MPLYPRSDRPSVAPEFDVSVLVPVRNEEPVIEETAKRIIGQHFDGSVEFLFIDGRSEDGTRMLLERLARGVPEVRVLDNPRRELTSALQVGLRQATGEFVAKMDAHTYFDPSYLQRGVDRLRLGDAEWVSGPPVPEGVDAFSHRVSLALQSRLGVGGSRKWGSSTDPETGEFELDTGVFSGVWRRTTLEAFGGWDEDFPVNEDSELASRYLTAGHRILCLPGMAARYVPRRSFRELARQYWRYGHYRAKTANRHPHSLRRSAILSPTLVTVLLAAPLGGRSGRRLALLTLGVYGASLTSEATRLAAARGRLTDIGWLPAILATMHFSWGAGFLVGCGRFGLPLAAVAELVRRERRVQPRDA